MPTFRLQPAASGRDDPSWAASRYHGVLLVVAADAGSARCFADGACGTPIWCSRTDGPLPRLPWTQSRLVLVTEVATESLAPVGTVIRVAEMDESGVSPSVLMPWPVTPDMPQVPGAG